ncbi:MAG: MATE family efflux transporter [Clostridia bacterium]|nr:MATE family efflux transporter [Clostridia bacterium]
MMKENKITDMTTGSPVRLILIFAIPLLIGNVFQQIYNVVDTMVVGYSIGDSAISAIGATSSLYSLIITFASSLNSGYAIVVTQAFGAHDNGRLRKSVAGMILLNIIATVFITSLSLVFLRPLMDYMNTPSTVLEQAYGYIFIICAGMFSTNAYNMFAGLIRALGNSRTPLYHLIAACVLNIILDILLVAVFGMGVEGAALATVLSQCLSAALSGVYFFGNYKEYAPCLSDYKVPFGILRDLLSTGTAMALMMCVVNLGSVFFQRANNALGESMIVAHTSARKIITIMMQPMGTIATATSTFVAQNWGAGKLERIRSSLRKVMLAEVLWGLFACTVIFASGSLLIQLMTGTEDAEIISNSVLSLRTHHIFFPVLGVLLCLRTSMQAMGYKKAPVISSCIELVLKWLSAMFLIPKVGFFGTCITEPVTWVFMLIYLGLSYLMIRNDIYQEKSFC